MAVLSLEGVSKSYWRGRHEIAVLDDVTLTVGAGEIVAVLGTRAAGKTTLLRVACGIEAPDRGVVRFEGRDLAARRRGPRLAGVPRAIGWVRRAGPAIPSMTVLDHVALPLLGQLRHRDAHRRATRVLADVGVPEVAGATWAQLSDTERTLVAIAQATIHEPTLVLADDPASGLDVGDRERVLAVLRRAVSRHGAAVLMTAAELPELLRADAVHALSGGELLAARPIEADVIPFRRPAGMPDAR